MIHVLLQNQMMDDKKLLQGHIENWQQELILYDIWNDLKNFAIILSVNIYSAATWRCPKMSGQP